MTVQYCCIREIRGTKYDRQSTAVDEHLEHWYCCIPGMNKYCSTILESYQVFRTQQCLHTASIPSIVRQYQYLKVDHYLRVPYTRIPGYVPQYLSVRHAYDTEHAPWYFSVRHAWNTATTKVIAIARLPSPSECNVTLRQKKTISGVIRQYFEAQSRWYEYTQNPAAPQKGTVLKSNGLGFHRATQETATDTLLIYYY